MDVGVRHSGKHQQLEVQEELGRCWGETWKLLPRSRACEFMGTTGSRHPAVHIWPDPGRGRAHLAEQL